MKYLDDEKFVEGFQECMERQRERVLKASDDDLKETTELYLKYVDAFDKVSKTQNNMMIEEAKNALECERFDKEFSQKRETSERELELKFNMYLEEKRKAKWQRIGTGAKLFLTGAAIAASFAYEARDNIYTGATSRGILSSIFRKPTDNLR